MLDGKGIAHVEHVASGTHDRTVFATVAWIAGVFATHDRRASFCRLSAKRQHRVVEI